jgi:hypothetical protein
MLLLYFRSLLRVSNLMGWHQEDILYMQFLCYVFQAFVYAV